MARTVSDFDLTPNKGANDQIDWGSVATKFSSNITDALSRREARKKAIATQYSQQSDKLSVIGESDDPTIQAQLVKASQASMRELSDRYDLVKNGLLSPEEFSLFQTNQRADYKTTSMYMKGMGKWVENIKQKIDNNNALEEEIYLYDYLTKYGGLQGVELSTGKNGRLVYRTQKNTLTLDGAKKILAEQRGVSGNPGGIAQISDEDAKAFIKANPRYEDGVFEKGRANNMNVQDLYKLFSYRGNPGVVVDTNGAIAEQVKVLGDYSRSFFNKDTGVTTTITDIRNAPGTDDKTTGGAFRESVKILQDKLATSDGEVVQVLTTLGGYRLATDAEDAKSKYGDDVDLSKIIFTDYTNGEISYSNLDGKKAIADKIIEKEFDRQLDSTKVSSAPNTAYLKWSENKGKEKEELTTYVNAIEKMITTDDIEEYNSQARLLIQRVNSSGKLGTNKLNSIRRENNSYILVFEDEFSRTFEETPIQITQGEGTLKLHEALFSLINPTDVTFDIYKGALETEGTIAINTQDYQRALPAMSIISKETPIIGDETTGDYLKKKFDADVRTGEMNQLPGTVAAIFNALYIGTGLEGQVEVSFIKPNDEDGLRVIIGGVDYTKDINWTSSGGMEEGFGGINTETLNSKIHEVYQKALKANRRGSVSSTSSVGELDDIDADLDLNKIIRSVTIDKINQKKDTTKIINNPDLKINRNDDDLQKRIAKAEYLSNKKVDDSPSGKYKVLFTEEALNLDPSIDNFIIPGYTIGKSPNRTTISKEVKKIDKDLDFAAITVLYNLARRDYNLTN